MRGGSKVKEVEVFSWPQKRRTWSSGATAKGLKLQVRAVTDAPSPRNAFELKSYLGMINYYQKYLPNLAIELAPLHESLKIRLH